MDCKGVPMVPSERAEGKEKRNTKVRRGKGDKRKNLRRDAVVTTHFTFNPTARTPEEMLKILMKEHTELEKLKQKDQKKERKLKGELPPENPLTSMFMLPWMVKSMHSNDWQIKWREEIPDSELLISYKFFENRKDAQTSI